MGFGLEFAMGLFEMDFMMGFRFCGFCFDFCCGSSIGS